MRVKLEIFQNKELVNTITSESEAFIYKSIAQCLFAKETKRASKTTFSYGMNRMEKITQYFDKTKTSLNCTYTYKYEFDGVDL